MTTLLPIVLILAVLVLASVALASGMLLGVGVCSLVGGGCGRLWWDRGHGRGPRLL